MICCKTADSGNKITNKRYLNFEYFVALSLIWLISPFIGMLTALILILKIQITKKTLKSIFFFISLSFSFLAFTQKSLYWDGTDIERYYFGLKPILNEDYSSIPLLLAQESLTYVFTPINILLVIATHNVQSISILWTFVIYYFFFNSILNFIELYHPKEFNDRYLWFATIIFSIFGSILFVQVTETIKSAVAISFFFYIFTLYLKGAKKTIISVLLFLCIGIHAQTLMLIPIFLYKHFRFQTLAITTIVTIVVCTQINIINLVLSILPSSGWAGLLTERAMDYGNDIGASSSKRYLFIGLSTFLITIILYHYKYYNESNRIGNIILIYIIVMFLNYTNSNAFIRFANFISFIATIQFIELFVHKKTHQLSYLLSFIYFILNFQMTIGRTISGGYCSSYMDNSIFKIIFSNAYDYLTFIAYT